MSRIAVFGTSEIFTVHWSADRVELPRHLQNKLHRATMEDDVGIHHVYSTGRLERAIRLGYDVYVASTRERLDEHDSWWVGMVGKDHVFLAREWKAGEDVPVSSGWVELFGALGLAYPIAPSPPPSVRLAHWTTARDMLKNYGIRLGSEFGGDDR